MKRATIAGLLIVTAFLHGCRNSEPETETAPAETVSAAISSEPDVTIAVSPEIPPVGKPAEVRVQVIAPSGSPPRLEPIAGIPVHLVAVNRDLTWYEHVHPSSEGEAWVSGMTFRQPGESVLHVILKPENYRQLVHKRIVTVGTGAATAPKRPLVISPREKRSESYMVRLRSNPEPPAAGIWSSLIFEISRDGKPVTNLTPTGTLGHIVILREGGEDFVFAHSTDGEALRGLRGRAHLPTLPKELDSHRRHVGDTGPEVTFHTQFPRLGKYKLWVEFLAGSESVKADFVVDVGNPPPPPKHVD